MNQPTPAIVAQSAVSRLPRTTLWLFCIAYVVTGFVGREPWKNADVMALGYMFELAHGTADWLQPTLLGLPPEFDALLPYWLGAVAMQWAPSWLAPDFAARLPFIALLGVAFAATWYAAYFLARAPAAQPVAFAFGGEAQPIDYARAIADGALLALIACFGLMQLSHETTPSLAQLGFAALTFHGAAALPYRIKTPIVTLSFGLVGLALSGAPAMGLLFALGTALVHLADRVEDPDRRRSGRASAVTVMVVAAVASLVALAFGAWHWRLGGVVTRGIEWGPIAKLLAWFIWPAWPFALWTLWRWRRQLFSRHVALPAWFLLVALAAALSSQTPDRGLLLGLPAIAALASFALPTFQRAVSSLIDWFAVIFFSGSALVIWVIWLSLQTGIPPKPAANVARLAPGFVPSFGLIPFLAALAATCAWIWLVRWRTSRHRPAIWKSVVLPAGGAALGWILVMTLWLPVLDYARSYLPVVSGLQKLMARPGCVEALNLSRPQIAALRFHGRLDLHRASAPATCPWLVASSDTQTLPARVDWNEWTQVGVVPRPSDASETLVLYHRAR